MTLKKLIDRAGAMVSWIGEETHVPKVVGSNPGTAYWMYIFFAIISCKNCNVCLKKTKINEIVAEDSPF